MKRLNLFPVILFCLITRLGNPVIAANVNPDLENIRKISVSDPTGKLAKIQFSVTSRIEIDRNHFKAVWNK
jgi:hypothetical protein